MGCCNNPCKHGPHFPEAMRGHSFEWRGAWEEGIYYYNDEFITDFISYNNVVLACNRNHLSSINSEPELIYENGVPVGENSQYWSFVMAGGSGGGSADFSDLMFRFNNNVLEYSTDGGNTYTTIGTFTFTESDPVFNASAAKNITASDISRWNGLVSNTQSDWSVNNSDDPAYIKNKPTIPSAVTETTISNWGFTKNAGTVTSVRVNGTTYNPTSGLVDLGTISGGGGTMNYEKLTSAQYVARQQAGTLDNNVLYIIVD